MLQIGLAVHDLPNLYTAVSHSIRDWATISILQGFIGHIPVRLHYANAAHWNQKEKSMEGT